MIEAVGIPTMAVTRGGFSQVVGNAFAGFGFPAEGPTVYEFPIPMFFSNSDLSPINENIDKIVYGLTKWQPKITAKGVYPAKKVTVTGTDYQGAVTNMSNLFLKNMWGDGLPITPATEERVNWILTGTDLPRDTTVGAGGRILPRGGISTVEALAVCLAMAGGRPEYLPVLIAAVEAILDPACVHQSWVATTSGTFPVVIVNGPIAKQIRLGSGYGCLGPDPCHPAGGSIGHAIRFLLQDMGGAIPGIGTMSLFGANRHTNLVFAEDEDGIPKGWEPLSVERGFPEGSNVVSHLVINSQATLTGGIRGPLGVKGSLLYCGAGMAGPHKNREYGNPESVPGILLVCRNTAGPIADLGWSKLDTKEFLWENSKTPFVLIEQYYATERGNGSTKIKEICETPGSGVVEGEPWPIAVTPDKIQIVVCGGAQSGHSHWLGRSFEPEGLVSKEIKLPAKAKWDALLKQAETDLGPIPAPMA